MSGGDSNYYVKKGDLEPPLTLFLTDASGRVPNFQSKQILFYMWKRGSATYVIEGRVGELEDAPSGKVSCDWALGDTSEEGTYKVEVKLVIPGETARAETFPAKGAQTVQITSGR